MFNDGLQRRLSDTSLQSTISGLVDNVPLTTINACKFADNNLWQFFLLINYSIICSTTKMVGLKTIRLCSILPRWS